MGSVRLTFVLVRLMRDFLMRLNFVLVRLMRDFFDAFEFCPRSLGG